MAGPETAEPPKNSTRQSISGRSDSMGSMMRTFAWRVLRWMSASPVMRVTSPLKTRSGSRLQRIFARWPTLRPAASASGTSTRTCNLSG
jgi:hypothetical protein